MDHLAFLFRNADPCGKLDVAVRINAHEMMLFEADHCIDDKVWRE